MDIQELRTFCRAVETGNLSGAAVALHITKSVASRRIRALEDDLGVRLLRRTTRGVSTTAEGGRFYERAQKILDDLDDARQSVKAEDEESLSGKLRMTAPRAFSDLVLQPSLIEFAHANPAIELEMTLSDARSDVLSEGFDLALRITRDLEDTSLIARKLADIRNVLVASPAYIEQHGEITCPSQLKDHSCIYYAHLNVSKQWQFPEPDGGKGHESVRVSGRLMTNSGQMQTQLAMNGLGVSILPRFFVNDHIQEGRLISMMEDRPPAGSALYALYPEKRHNPVRVKKLIDALQQYLKRPELACYL